MGAFLRIKPERLADRLDAVYYHPDFIQNEERLYNSKFPVRKLKSLVYDGRRAIYFSTKTLEEKDAPKSWVPFLTADDLGSEGFFIDLNARRRVSPDFAAKYSNGLIRANELLVKVKGPNQTTAYNKSKPDQDALVSGTIWGALVKKDRIDPHYLVAILSCPYASVARSRLRTNTNVEFLSPTDLLNLELIEPKINAQKYIGDKVRQAERLREWAKGLEQTFNNELVQIYTVAFNKQVDNRKYANVKKNDLSIDLNPGLYNGERLRVRKSIFEISGKKIGHIAIIKAPSSNEYTSSTKFLGLDGISSNNSSLAITTIGKTNVKGTLRYLLSGPIIPKINPYLNKAAYIPKELEGTVGSPELLCIIPKAKPDGWFIYGALKQETTLKQLNPISTGSTHLRVTPDNIRDIVIPWPEDRVKKGKYLEKAFRARQLSSTLTTTAKLLVESLIEGKITESQLINAQQNLEKGDTSLDQSNLERIKTDGMDGQGEPLFTDLEQVYELLKQAENMDENMDEN